MKTLLLRFLFLASFIQLSLFAFSQEKYPNSLLWKITGKGLEKPSYLFGTMHLKDARIFNFSDSLYHFLEQSEGYAMEIDPEEAMTHLFRSLSDPDTSRLLHTIMDKEEFKKAAKNLEKLFGVPANKVTKKQASLYKLGVGYGDTKKSDDMESAIDTYLFNIAKRQGKWVGGIEDVEDQFGVLDEFFTAEDFVKDKKRNDAQIEKMIKIYLAQDLNSIVKYMASSDSLYNDAFLIKRNIKMSRRIDSLMRIRTHFFAVGAAHLPSKQGVIQLLSSLGFTVTPVFSNIKIAPANYKYTSMEMPWKEVKDEEGNYIISMPGSASDVRPNGELVKMKVYTDLGTGLFYSIATTPILGNKNTDSILQQVAANYLKSSKGAQPEKILYQGRSGMYVQSQNDGNYFNMRLFSENNQVIMVMVGGPKKEQLENADTKRFFESLSIIKKPISNEWTTHEDRQKAYKVSFPGKPLPNEQMEKQMQEREGMENWSLNNLTYTDIANQVYYMLFVKETKPGYFIISDQQMFEEGKASMESNPDIKLTYYETGKTADGLSCAWINGTQKQGSYLIKSFHVNKGNRSYSLMAVYDKNIGDTTLIDRYFTSFNVLDYTLEQWKTYQDSASTFSTFAPSSFSTSLLDSAAQMTSSIAFDKSTGVSFHVEKEGLPIYYWVENDSTLYAKALTSAVSYEDSLLYEKDRIINGLKGKEYKILLKNEGRNIRHGFLFYNGDSLYNAFTIVPSTGAQKNYEAFLSQFQLLKPAATSRLFKNQAKRLLEDIASADTSVFEKAKAAFDDAPFTQKDLPLLHQALLNTYQDFDIKNYNLSDQVSNKVIKLADSSTISFIAKNYLSVKHEALKYSLLNILASYKTKESYSVLKSLLLNNKPSIGDANGLSYKLNDSIALTQLLFPEVLPLFSDTLFSNVLPSVINSLLDSNLLLLSIVKPYEKTILTECKRLSLAFEKSDDGVYWDYSEWMALISRFQTKEAYDLLQQFSKSKLTYVKYAAVKELIQAGQSLEPKVLQALAADMYYRVELYTLLKAEKKLALFPAQYANHQSLSQSLLMQWDSDDYEPTQVNFIATKQATYKGKTSTFYLFKVVYEYEEGEIESYLGVVGPFSKTDGLSVDEKDIFMSEEAFDSKLVNKQFELLLKEMDQ